MRRVNGKRKILFYVYGFELSKIDDLPFSLLPLPFRIYPSPFRLHPFSFLYPLALILYPFMRAMTRTSTKVAKKFVIRGRVQGVGYRYFADRVASELGIWGYVKNLWDGNVEVYAIGEAVALEEMKRQLAEGPRSARVTAFDESDVVVDKRYNRFNIEGGW